MNTCCPVESAFEARVSVCVEEPKMNRLLLAALFFSMANATPVGAPIEACDTLEPQHGVVGQTTPSPYAFVVVNNGDGTYQGTINSIPRALYDMVVGHTTIKRCCLVL